MCDSSMANGDNGENGDREDVEKLLDSVKLLPKLVEKAVVSGCVDWIRVPRVPVVGPSLFVDTLCWRKIILILSFCSYSAGVTSFQVP